MIPLFQKHQILLLALVFVVTVATIAVGTGRPTSPTSKDEYHRVFRTALEMMESDVWLVPLLDGRLRIEKPPLLSWLTRASFEVFGVSIAAARLIVLLFSGLLIAVISAIGLKILHDVRYALIAALIALSSVGMAIHGRILLADIPTAALSGVAFYFFLQWSTAGLTRYLFLAGLALAVSFMTKGPVAFVVFGAGLLAALISDANVRNRIRSSIPQVIAALMIFGALSASWYAYVFLQFPDHTLRVLDSEYEARRFGRFQIYPILQFGALFFPWTLFLLAAEFRRSSGNGTVRDRQSLTLLLWVAFSLMPFLFIRSFDRYLVGTLIPASLFCAQTIETIKIRIAPRTAVVIAAVLLLPMIAFCHWFRTANEAMLAAVFTVLLAFACVWWRAKSHWQMVLVSAALWNVIFGIVFPRFGVNEIPSELFLRTKDKLIFFFLQPQPAMLPILEGRSGKLITDLSEIAETCVDEPLLFAVQNDLSKLENALPKASIEAQEIYRYKTILAFEKLLGSAFKGEASDAWRSAAQLRSLEPLMTVIVLFKIACGSYAPA